ncbi:hypothetical protein [Streptomyces qinzhouensis]|uniref:Uncharacterized protein n=1 Tax=Streptomyces qinzhouensis TaxID=2599401 RepID=A0A5B8J7F7_9ACTN|nr:hypothetical protein [Streptomyces qinzhouensis]QDY77156.1 hypothetical protein FQU76_12240 [Streptomyces qinzhouensis]
MTNSKGYQHHNTVNIYGGTDHTGVHYGPRTTGPTSLDAGVRELSRLLTELRAGVPEGEARTLDQALVTLTAPTAQPQNRRNALMAIAGVAATAGALGQPVLAMAQQLAQLLGG